MSIGFKEFITKWNAGTLNESATWRAYAFEKAVTPFRIKDALKSLGFGYASDHAMTHMMAHYGLKDRREAEVMVASWRMLVRAERGSYNLAPLRHTLDLFHGTRTDVAKEASGEDGP